MILRKFLKPASSDLPTAERTGLPEKTVHSANCAVTSASKEGWTSGRKRKYTTSFTAEDRAKVGKYAAENRIVVAQSITRI